MSQKRKRVRRIYGYVVIASKKKGRGALELFEVAKEMVSD